MISPKDLPAEMPEHLATLVCAFANTYGHLREVESAHGQCVDTTYDFLALLHRSKYDGEWCEVSWEMVLTDSNCYDIVDGPWLPKWVNEVFVGQQTRAHEEFGGHTAACVDEEWFIDFTARQFDPSSPWPLIWRLD